jgi:hypothetical protein
LVTQIIDDGWSVLRNRCDAADLMSLIAHQQNGRMLSSFQAHSNPFPNRGRESDVKPTVIGQNALTALSSVQAITLRVALYRERFRSLALSAAPVIRHRVGYEGSFCRVGSLQARRFVTQPV